MLPKEMSVLRVHAYNPETKTFEVRLPTAEDVTDEMVERALSTWYEKPFERVFPGLDEANRQKLRDGMRLTLEAVLRGA